MEQLCWSLYSHRQNFLEMNSSCFQCFGEDAKMIRSWSVIKHQLVVIILVNHGESMVNNGILMVNTLIGGDWNMNGLWLSIYWKCHNPNWLSYFQRSWNHQPECIQKPLIHDATWCTFFGPWSAKATVIYIRFIRKHQGIEIWGKQLCTVAMAKRRKGTMSTAMLSPFQICFLFNMDMFSLDTAPLHGKHTYGI